MGLRRDERGRKSAAWRFTRSNRTVGAGRSRRRRVALGRRPEKLNVGQLGNITRQLHVHIVGRRRDDPCWPGPVWGQSVAQAYREDALASAKAAALRVLAA